MTNNANKTLPAASSRGFRLRLSLVAVLALVVLAMGGANATAASVFSTFSAGPYPRAIAVDESTGRTFVTHGVAGAGTSVFDADGSPLGSLPAGTFGAAIDLTANRVYVTESTDRTLRAYDLGNLGQVASVSVGPSPYTVAVNSQTNRIYVVSQSSEGIDVIDGVTASVIARIPIPGWPPYGVAVDANTNRIYATGINGGTVSVIDGATNTVITDISVGNQPNAIAADPQTNRIYVTNQGSNSVSVIDGATDAVVATIPVGNGPQAIAVNPARNRVYVANTNANSLSIIDGETQQVVQTIAVGPVPIGVAVNSNTNRVYVSNDTSDGTVTIVDDSPPPPPDFVTRDGTRLLIDGQPYRPIGLNIYNANSNGWCWYSMDGSILNDSLTAIGAGKNAMRAWFFQQLATTNGVRDWTAFDRTLSTARAHGYRVVVTLIDQWGDCGTTNGQGYGYKTPAWYQTGYTQPDPSATVSYRDWVAEVVSRYKNDPTILAWQLVNEPEVLVPNADGTGCDEATAEPILYSFASDVGGLIKANDPNHLVSLGTLGSGQCGAQYTDYQQVMSIPSLDLCEFHDYEYQHPMPGDQFNGLQFRINQCDELDKPLLVGELGVRPDDVGGTLADRANVVSSKLCVQLTAGVAGVLLWAWDKDGSTLNNYDIGPGDPVMDVLRPWSNPTHICSPPSAPTGVVAAPGDGNVAVAWLQPANDGGAAITGYTVTPHDLTSGSDGTAVPASGTRVTVEGLINGHTYTFTVTARNVAGTSAASGASSPVTPRVGNPPPAAAAGTASPTNATTISTGDDPATTGGTATSVTVPSGTAGGTVSVVQAAASVSAASGYQFGRVQVDVSAPTATATNPLTLVFTIAPPLDEPPPPDPVTLASTQIFRTEGTGTPVLVADCSTAGEALPDGSPCVSSRRYTTINGQAYIQLTVLSASASHWNTARPTARAVSVSDRGYSPQNVTIQPGAYVRWTFTGSRRHSVTDSVGLGNARSPWFDSGARLSGSYSFNFPAAGRFSYRSTARGDSMTGAVLVPVVATPTTGHATTSFSVIWSTRQLSGYVFNVQYRFKPAGSPNWRLWTNWKSGVATASSAFVPSQGAGTYAFRAQMRNSATGRSSDYSPDTTITVS